MRIVLDKKNRLYVLENPIPNAPGQDVEEKRNEHQRHIDDDEQTACMMLANIQPEF